MRVTVNVLYVRVVVYVARYYVVRVNECSLVWIDILKVGIDFILGKINSMCMSLCVCVLCHLKSLFCSVIWIEVRLCWLKLMFCVSILCYYLIIILDMNRNQMFRDRSCVVWICFHLHAVRMVFALLLRIITRVLSPVVYIGIQYIHSLT